MPVVFPIDAELITDLEILNNYTTNVQNAISVANPYAAPQRSPGWLGLIYLDTASNIHRTQYHLVNDADPYNIGQMVGEADRIAQQFAKALQGSYVVAGYFVKDADGVEIYSSTLPAAYLGTHAGGGVDALSFSVTITGRGAALAPGLHPGEELCRFFPERGYPFNKGRKFINLAEDIALLQYAGALGTSRYVWADFHGWKAGIRPNAPIQFNAAVQRKKGV